MKTFLRHQQALRLEVPNKFATLISQHNKIMSSTVVGSLAQSLPQNSPEALYHLHSLSTTDLPEVTLDFNSKSLGHHIKL